MSVSQIVQLMRAGIFHIFLLAAPVLGAALIIGLIVAIFQATTSIQEQTLTFLPKLLAILGVLALIGTWMFNTAARYTIQIFNLIPELAK